MHMNQNEDLNDTLPDYEEFEDDEQKIEEKVKELSEVGTFKNYFTPKYRELEVNENLLSPLSSDVAGRSPHSSPAGSGRNRGGGDRVRRGRRSGGGGRWGDDGEKEKLDQERWAQDAVVWSEFKESKTDDEEPVQEAEPEQVKVEEKALPTSASEEGEVWEEEAKAESNGRQDNNDDDDPWSKPTEFVPTTTFTLSSKAITEGEVQTKGFDEKLAHIKSRTPLLSQAALFKSLKPKLKEEANARGEFFEDLEDDDPEFSGYREAHGNKYDDDSDLDDEDLEGLPVGKYFF